MRATGPTLRVRDTRDTSASVTRTNETAVEYGCLNTVESDTSSWSDNSDWPAAGDAGHVTGQTIGSSHSGEPSHILP